MREVFSTGSGARVAGSVLYGRYSPDLMTAGFW